MLRRITSGLEEYFFGTQTDNALRQHIQFVEEFHIQDKNIKKTYIKQLERDIKINRQIKRASNLTLLGSAFCYAFFENKYVPLMAAVSGEFIRIGSICFYSCEKAFIKKLSEMERNNSSLDIKMQSTYGEDQPQDYEKDGDWWKNS